MEHKPGDTRSGVAPDGTPWSVVLPHYYGEVRDTIGADGDAVDVLLLADPDPFAPWVYVIQAKFPGEQDFDETKSVLGAGTQDEAVSAFRSMYNKPGFFLGCTRWPIGAWREAMTRPSVSKGTMEAPLEKAVMIDAAGLLKLLAEGASDGLPSAFAIGDPVVVSTYGGEIAGHVRAVTFSAGKVRYAVQTHGAETTTLYNVDSSFVKPWDGVPIHFEFDPFELDGDIVISAPEFAGLTA
jgi:hypothetical protein